MPITVTCSSCHRKLRVPDDLLGKRVKCPTCTNVFEATLNDETAPAPHSEPIEESIPEPSPARSKAGSGRGEIVRTSRSRRDDERDEDDRPRSRSRRDEAYDEDDGRRRSRRRRRRRRGGRDYEPHRGALVLTFGIISCALFLLELCGGFLSVPGWIASIVLAIIGMGLSITAWTLGTKDLGRMRAGVMDPDGQGITQGGYVCGIVGTILNAIALGCCLLASLGLLAVLGIGLSNQGARPRPGGRFEVPAHALPHLQAPPTRAG